jgi:hypothetical protein
LDRNSTSSILSFITAPQVRHNLLATQPFQDTFGNSSKRKRPRLTFDSLAELANHAEEREGR